jgi:hypothetical protein
MIGKFVRRAPTVLVIIHGLLWATVMAVWFFAWRNQPEPMGPSFNFAKRFLSRIDILVSSPLDGFSVTAALNIAKWIGTDLGLGYTILFGVLILLAGTVQWFLIGRLVQWVATKFGDTGVLVLSSGVGCALSLAFVSWAMSW